MNTDLLDALNERILVLDGAMGTMIQAFDLQEADYQQGRFADHPISLKGCSDILCLTRPDVIQEIHRQFFQAGADIIETNTFGGNAFALGDYQLQDEVYSINKAGAEIARAVAEEFMQADGRRRWVAGSMGPTTVTTSISPDVNDPAARTATFAQLADTFAEQARALLDGGVDFLLPETSIDTLNMKAALYAIAQVFEERQMRVPVMASFTITDASGRTLSGQTVEALWHSISHFPLFAVSLNCALGAEQMLPYVQELSRLAPIPVSCFPNAGLPNEFGEYDASPESMADTLEEFVDQGWLNIVGGCCGTRPKHIQAIAQRMQGKKPRTAPPPRRLPSYSGMEPLTIFPDSNFLLVGERTNITGSRRFARLIREENYEAALSVARQQVEGGANILDVNMDEGLIDSVAVMRTFLNLIASEPDIARIPIMIDSSKWEVLEEGLQCVQGKSIVNSISLKDGEALFLERARKIRQYGAAVVVMAFDETGQATSKEDKVAICQRAYKLLTEEVGFPAEDIIFDPNILTVATGIEEHNDYALNFIEALREIKNTCPGALTSGGVSNISFSFRGNDFVREAMHAAFLYHAIQAGLDMGIVNAGQLQVYSEIPEDLLQHIEDVLFNRHPDATEKLVDLAQRFQSTQVEREAAAQVWRESELPQRLAYALRHGVADYLEEDLQEALKVYDKPLSIIEGPLMDGMNIIGDLFGAGQMFLPQVVKSARVMKKAVAFLEPLMEDDKASAQAKGKVLLATVKGDVHDIGKNIVGVVMACNNYEIIDLGVMVPADKILAAAREQQVDIVGLSGLITPSLDEMVHVASEMQRQEFKLPLLIGGATTSRKHTAVKIAPAYAEPVVHVLDASRSVGTLQNLLTDSRESFLADLEREQNTLRERFAQRKQRRPLLSIAEARQRKPQYDWSEAPPVPAFTGVRLLEEIALDELVPYIDWTPFFTTWELHGSYPRILDDAKVGPSARELFEQAQGMLKRIVDEKWLQPQAVYGFFKAQSQGDDMHLEHEGQDWVLHSLRQQEARKKAEQLALADWLAPAESGQQDYLGAFVVTAGHGVAERVAAFKAEHDDYSAIMLQALADRLAEALAEKLHQQVRQEWGFKDAEDIRLEDLIKERYRGIRPAPGYPACPDHSEKRKLFKLLQAERIGVTLTEHCAMTPPASVSGLYFSHPDSRYFSIGKLGPDQIQDYAQRKGWTLEEAQSWLRPWLAESE